MIMIPIHAIHLPPNITKGMNVEVVVSIAHQARCSTIPVTPPIQVFQRDGCWHIHDGRHRFFGHVIAGHTSVPCVEIEDPGAVHQQNRAA